MDEQTVRETMAAVYSQGDPLIDESDVGDVIVEGDTAIVVLRREAMPHELLAQIHRRLAGALPDATIELRPAGQVYRGGAGFGEGKHVIAVVGGKGGVGKSTIAVNLALTLTAMGLRVGLLDGDLSAPDLPHMLGVHLPDPQALHAVPKGMTTIRPPRTGVSGAEPPSGGGWGRGANRPLEPTMGRGGAARVPQFKQMQAGVNWQIFTSKPMRPSARMRPEKAYGLEMMSVGFVVPERLPPSITGRVYVAALLRYLIFDVAWTADVLLIDAPPGTGEEIQIMARELPLSGAVFVTTPQDLAQMDAERTLTYLNDNGVPVIGLVQNMAAMTCPHCEREIDMFAASSRLTDAGVPVLGRIPFDTRLSVTADQGRPLVLGDPRGPIAYEFARIGAVVRRWVGNGGPHPPAPSPNAGRGGVHSDGG